MIALAILGAAMLLLGLILAVAPFTSRSSAARETGGVLIALGFAVGAISFVSMSDRAFGRDIDGRYAQSTLKPWFDQLKSGKGLCCSDADGTAISDADWEVKAGHYRVRVPIQQGGGVTEWIDVPEESVITEPNRAGKTMVWPLYGYGGVTIRCFLPGSMT